MIEVVRLFKCEGEGSIKAYADVQVARRSNNQRPACNSR